MKIISIVLFVLLLSCQKHKSIPKISQSTNQVAIERLYNNLSSISEESSDSILLYANKMEYLARNEPKEYRSMALFFKGVSYANGSSYLLSNKHLESALQLLKDSKADTLNAKIFNGFASNYMNTGDYPKALNNIYKALKIYERHQNKIV